MGASVGLQSRFFSDRFSYFRSSLLYICSGLDISLITSELLFGVKGRFIRVSDQLDQRSDQGDMDSQIVTVDQFATAMASIKKAIASLD